MVIRSDNVTPIKNEAIVATDLTKSFGEGEAKVTAVNKVGLVAHFGEMLFIVGPSGSGKTTLLSMISGILRQNAGKVTVKGADIWTPNNDQLADFRLNTIGFVFQDYHLFPRLTTAEDGVNQATASLKVANVLLQKYSVRASVDGIALAVNATVGSYVSSRGAFDSYTEGFDPLIIMGAPQNFMDVRCFVDEILISRLPSHWHITAQTTLLNNQRTALNLQMEQLTSSVQLIKALGGGWNTSLETTAATP